MKHRSVDFEYANLLNATIKLLGMAQLSPDGSKVRPSGAVSPQELSARHSPTPPSQHTQLSVAVSPFIVPREHPIATTNGSTNIVNIASRYAPSPLFPRDRPTPIPNKPHIPLTKSQPQKQPQTPATSSPPPTSAPAPGATRRPTPSSTTSSASPGGSPARPSPSTARCVNRFDRPTPRWGTHWHIPSRLRSLTLNHHQHIDAAGAGLHLAVLHPPAHPRPARRHPRRRCVAC